MMGINKWRVLRKRYSEREKDPDICMEEVKSPPSKGFSPIVLLPNTAMG